MHRLIADTLFMRDKPTQNRPTSPDMTALNRSYPEEYRELVVRCDMETSLQGWSMNSH